MKFASLGSGSAGNATLVSQGANMLLVDCGFGIRETERRMSKLQCSPDMLNAILVTHEHGDHVKGVAPLARKYNLPVFMTKGTYLSRDYGKIADLRLIENYQPFVFANMVITPVAVPHDAREPAQYVFEHNGIKLGILTDLGSITEHVIAAYADCDGLLVEANHDLEMLARGPYPPSLKARVSGNWGHLNNRQTCEFLRELNSDVVQRIVIGHISSKNNSLVLAKRALASLTNLAEKMCYACQDEGMDWYELLPNAIASQSA